MVLVKEAANHQSEMDKLQTVLASLKKDYVHLKEEIEELDLPSEEQCSETSQNDEMKINEQEKQIFNNETKNVRINGSDVSSDSKAK